MRKVLLGGAQVGHIIGESGGLAVDQPAIGLIVGVLIVLMGVANWFLAARFGDVMRREPGWYGRRSSTLFLVGIGVVVSVVSLINL